MASAAPDLAIVALVIVIVVPLLLLAWYYRMYTDIGKSGLTGGGLREGDERKTTDRESPVEHQ